jgi:hypothetical protein
MVMGAVKIIRGDASCLMRSAYTMAVVILFLHAVSLACNLSVQFQKEKTCERGNPHETP